MSARSIKLIYARFLAGTRDIYGTNLRNLLFSIRARERAGELHEIVSDRRSASRLDRSAFKLTIAICPLTATADTHCQDPTFVYSHFHFSAAPRNLAHLASPPGAREVKSSCHSPILEVCVMSRRNNRFYVAIVTTIETSGLKYGT